MVNFDFTEKGLEIVSPPHLVYDFSRKTFLTLYSISWPGFIAWLPLLLEILVNKCAVFAGKSAYARKRASLKLAPPIWRKIFNERLPRMSAPLFSQKDSHLKNNI